jgi:hypothetical protein
MGRTLKDDVFAGRWFRRGQSEAEVGDAAAQIGDHAWDPAESGAASAAPAPPDESPDDGGAAEPVDADNAPAVEPAEQSAKGHDAPEPPPQSGPGSSEKAWRAYAREVDVDVSGAKDRAGVIAFIEAAGKPVD